MNNNPQIFQNPKILRILSVDDNAANQMIVTQMLRRLGQADITMASNGQQAVDACRTSQFDLIFMDIRMPVMNGWEATSQIRALPGPRVFIIALTANATSDDQKKCIDYDIDQVITKPILMETLLGAVVFATEFHRSRQWIAEYDGKEFLGLTMSDVERQVFDYFRSLKARPDSKLYIYKNGTDKGAPLNGFA